MHPKSTLIVGIVGTVFFLLIAVLSAVSPGKTGSPAVIAAFLGFAALNALLLLEYRNARHELLPDGMRFGRLLKQGGTLRWAELRRVSYSESMKWFVLELGDQSVARISVMVTGLPEFAKAVLSQVSPTAIDPDTRAVLERTAAGDPPSVWR